MYPKLNHPKHGSLKDNILFFRKLLTDRNFTTAQFLAGNFSSENGRMIRDLVNRLQNTYNTVPDDYKQFLSDCSKMSPVTGFLQVTFPGTVLDLLKVFCHTYSAFIVETTLLQNIIQSTN